MKILLNVYNNSINFLHLSNSNLEYLNFRNEFSEWLHPSYIVQQSKSSEFKRRNCQKLCNSQFLMIFLRHYQNTYNNTLQM